MQFSIIIPMDFHRSRALDCIRGWVETQRMPADDFELICVLPSDDPDRLGDSIRPLLRPHDQLVPCDAHHDMDLCVQGSALALGAYLFFTESGPNTTSFSLETGVRRASGVGRLLLQDHTRGAEPSGAARGRSVRA